MMKLVLIRHGESEWNKLNLFTGWTDVGLTDTGREEAIEAGRLLSEGGFDFDVCYTSYLKRAIHTLDLVLAEMGRDFLPVYKDWALNERHYGALQGLNKAETAEKYGDEQVRIWRRSFAVTPPALEQDDERAPAHQRPYEGLDPASLPLTESLATTIERVQPYFDETIRPEMFGGKRILVVAHGNSLRALVKGFDGLTEEEILDVNIPTGVPLVYHFDDECKVEDKYYLGDAAAVEAKIRGVAGQGKAQG